MKRSREPEQDLDNDSQQKDTEYSAGSDIALQRVTNIAGWDFAVEDDHDEDHNDHHLVEMRCFLPPHKEPFIFKTYDEYEAHYNSFHTNRCLECRKNFPSEHLLGVHIEECHDPLVVVRRDRGEHTYSCFVVGCERKCLTWQKRRMHLIDKHMYPKNFFFAVSKDGIDGRRSLLVDGGHHRRRSSTTQHPKESRRRDSIRGAGSSQLRERPGSPPQPSGPEADGVESETSVDKDMSDLTGAMSGLQFVPPSVRFGRGRAGFAKK